MEPTTSYQFDNPERWPPWDDDGSGEGFLGRDTLERAPDLDTFFGGSLDLNTFKESSLENVDEEWPVLIHNATLAWNFRPDSSIGPPFPPTLNMPAAQPMEASPSMESLPSLTSPVSFHSATTYTSPLMGWGDIHSPLTPTRFPPPTLEDGRFHSMVTGMGQIFPSERYPVLRNPNLRSSPTENQDTGQEAATPRELTMEDRPPGVSAYVFS